MSEVVPAAPPPWRSQILAILRPPDGPQLLLVDDRLPLLSFDPFVAASDADRLVSELHTKLGCSAVLLGSAWGRYDEAARVLYAACIFVVPDTQWAPPPAARWAPQLDLATLPWPDDALHRALASELAQPRDAAVPLRQPWAVPGFWEAASEWIAASTAGTPWQLTGPVRQIRCWSISCVLRAPTANGDLFFKAAGGSELFADEPALMAALGRLYSIVPQPIAREAQRRWMLLPDLGQILRDSQDETLRVAAIAAFGRMQLALAGQIEQLLAAGLHDRRLAVLAMQIDPLLADADVAAVLGSERHARLLAAVPALRRVLERLDGYTIPPSVVHGDLHGGNIAVRDGSFHVFDWTDAAIAHPFFDLVILVGDESSAPKDAAPAQPLLAHYLALWQGYETPARLREIWRLAHIAGALHQLVSYQYITRGLETSMRWELSDGGLTYFADVLLRKLAALEENDPRIHANGRE